MPFEEILNNAETLLAPFAVGATRHEGFRLDVAVTRNNLCPAVKALVDARWGYLITITGLDLPWPKVPAKTAAAAAPQPAAEGTAPKADENPMEDKLEVLYHFTEGPVVTTLRVTVPYTDAHVPTICPLVPTATLYEREIQEMFGITVDGTPVPDRFVLPDDWPDGVYPLRKGFKGLKNESDGA
jgi:NADH:ubiquinone oxidoreductase subunit C